MATQNPIVQRVTLARRIVHFGDIVIERRRAGDHSAANLAEHERDTLRTELAAIPQPDVATLTTAQIDGLACVACGASFLARGAPASVPIGRTSHVAQVFACWPTCPVSTPPLLCVE